MEQVLADWTEDVHISRGSSVASLSTDFKALDLQPICAETSTSCDIGDSSLSPFDDISPRSSQVSFCYPTLTKLNSGNLESSKSLQDSTIEELWEIFGGFNPFYNTLEVNALEHPTTDAVIWLNGNCEVDSILTFQQLFAKVRNLALFLRDVQKLQPSDRVLLSYPPSSGLDFVICFYACLSIGVVAVPVYPADPSKPRIEAARLGEICTKARVSVILTNTQYRLAARVITTVAGNQDLSSMQWVCTNDIATSSNCDLDAFEPTLVRIDTVAFLQFTSGSTSAPKGVMVTHGNLLHNIHLICLTCSFPTTYEDPTTLFAVEQYSFKEFRNVFWPRRHGVSLRTLGHRVRALSWLPIYHDMGLIGCTMAPLTFGLTIYQMSPIDFIRRPHIWLQGLSKYECFTTGAPNFAFELAARRMPDDVYETLDLSKVTTMLCGAEPIRISTLDAFKQKFGPKGFRENAFLPAFGLAEHTLIVCGRQSYDAVPRLASVDADLLAEHGIFKLLESSADQSKTKICVGCGPPMRGVDVRIVDPEKHYEVEKGRIGEIWIRSSSKAIGYFHDNALSASTFSATITHELRSDEPSSPTLNDVSERQLNFLRTGDMGVFCNGELYVTGRLKDMIIIRGRKYFPQDIEAAVEMCDGVRKGCVAAFALNGTKHETLGIAVEMKPPEGSSAISGIFGLLPKVKEYLFGTNNHETKERYTELAEQIAAAVLSTTSLPIETLWLLKPKSIPKTTSGKIRRSITRDRVLSKNFTSVIEQYDFPLNVSKRLK